jgi:general stress protein YciG
MSKQTDISKAAAALGKRGGQAGTGAAKARSKEFYSEQGKKSGEVRRRNAELKRLIVEKGGIDKAWAKKHLIVDS